MKCNDKLVHLLGNFQDKLNVSQTIIQPHLSEMIIDLLIYPDYHQEKTPNYHISVMDILLSFLKNPNLSESNFNILYPKIFNPNFTSSFKETNVVKDLESHGFFSNEKKKELTSFMWDSYQNKSLNYLSQSILKSIAQEVNNNESHELFIFFQNKQKQLIKNTSGVKLLFFKNSAFKLKAFLEQNLLYISPNLDYVKIELKSRKTAVPAGWKQYSSKNFENLLTSSENQIVLMKHQRKNFLKQLKNRILSSKQIIAENEVYIEQLNKLINTLNSQKEEIEAKLKDLKAPENPK